MGRQRRRVVSALVALLAAPVAAVAATFEARVNATRIGLEDQVQLTITLADAAPRGEITMPALTGLEVVAGPSVSTQVSFVNGAISQSRSYVFLLRPTGVGQATIGPAAVQLADGERRTEAITIEVVPGSVLPRRPPPVDPLEEMFRRDPFEGFFGRRSQPATPPRLLVEAEASRRQVFVGEPVLLTFYLVTQTSVAGLELAEAPSFSGFWVEELPREDNPTPAPVTRDGETYQRLAVMRRLLYPTRAGSLTIPSLTFRVAIPRRIGFFADPTGTGVVTRASEPVEITVLPIPASEAEYGGAVGSFRLATSVDRREVQLGEAVQLRVAVEGKGNLKWVDRAPQVDVAGAKVYPPKVVDRLRATPAGLVGERAWEFVVVPETAGTLMLPALAFPHFDPAARAVRRAESSPIPITVRPAAAAAAGGGISAPAPSTLALRADLDVSGVPGEPAAGAVTAVLAMTLGAHALLLAAPLISRRRGRAGVRVGRRSTRALLADLRRAREAGVSKETAAATIERVLTEVFGDLEREEEGMSELARQARSVVREARLVRYAPQLGEYGEKLDELVGRAQELVRRSA
jgi:hypothetical protein